MSVDFNKHTNYKCLKIHKIDTEYFDKDFPINSISTFIVPGHNFIISGRIGRIKIK